MQKQTSRKLKLQEETRPLKYGGKPKTVPILRLGGDWLGDAGFKPGGRVHVIVREGLLIIEMVEEVKDTTNYKAIVQEVRHTLKKLGK